MKKVTTLLLFILMLHPAFAYEQLGEGDSEHARQWTKFADNVYKLHEKQLAHHKIRIEKRNGGYKKYPDSFVETSYYDEKTGLLLSRIKWRTDEPDLPHVMEVFVHDEHQHLLRDYTVAYVGFYYKHLKSSRVPNQALVSFYNQHDTLKAFRTFDASGDFVYESCSGTYEGKKIDMGFEEDEAGYMANSKEYKACFAGVPTSPGEYLDPH